MAFFVTWDIRPGTFVSSVFDIGTKFMPNGNNMLSTSPVASLCFQDELKISRNVSGFAKEFWTRFRQKDGAAKGFGLSILFSGLLSSKCRGFRPSPTFDFGFKEAQSRSAAYPLLLSFASISATATGLGIDVDLPA